MSVRIQFVTAIKEKKPGSQGKTKCDSCAVLHERAMQIVADSGDRYTGFKTKSLSFCESCTAKLGLELKRCGF